MRSKEIEDYKKQIKLTGEQREVLVGILLGDAHLETNNDGKTYKLRVEHSIKQSEYLWHLYEIYKDWCLSPPKEKLKKIDEKEYTNLAFTTVSHPAFRFYGKQFYPHGRKKVPNIIHKILTPKALAYWFMDDGSIKSKESKGVIFNTQGYVGPDVEKLITILQTKFNLDCKKRKQKEGFQIYISGESYEKFVELTDKYIIESMKYKIPPPRKT